MMQENIDIKQTANFINGIYDNLTYYDLYGSSIISFFIITLFVLLAFAFSRIIQSKEIIASDWENQRCKPQNIPFAGYISKPSDKTAFEYTNENSAVTLRVSVRFLVLRNEFFSSNFLLQGMTFCKKKGT